MNFTEVRKKSLSVLVVTDSRESLLEGPQWEDQGLHFLKGCRSAEIGGALELRIPDVVFVEQPVTGGALSVLEAITRSWPRLPVVLISDVGNWSGIRTAFIRGAFDCLIKPLTGEVIGGLVSRLQVRVENLGEGGVFSSRRAEAARSILFGNPPSFDADSLPGWQSQFWQAVSIEIVPGQPLAAIEALLEEGMNDSSALGLLERGPARPTLFLTAVFHDRTAARVKQMAALQVQNLVQMLQDSGSWAAAGLGTVGPAAEASASLQCARLAVGHSLAHGPGVYPFQAEREVAGLPCADLAHHADEIPSLIQGGGNWQEHIGLFFESLPHCASVRRLQQEVQRLFSRLADLVPSSPQVEKYYHIVDFVRGPEELRDELVSLCSLASTAVRTNGRSLADRKLQEFQDYIARHYAEQFDLARVCAELQISPSYLSKLLHKSLKTTFVKFVTDVRMAKSRELLSGTDLLTSQIAEQVGFVYTHYFSSLFKKRYATTPSEFRSECRASRW